MRAISGAAATALTQPTVPMALLVDMMLTSPLRVCTGGWTLTWNGYTYTAVGGLGSVEPVQENLGAPAALRFTLSGVPSSMVSLVLAEPVQGKLVNVYVAIFDPATYQILDAALEWTGKLDTMTLGEDGGTAVVTVTAEHAGLDLLRTVTTRYTDADQQRLYTGDLGFQYVTDQADQVLVWPAASFFRR
jgi:hypothetical protein